MNHRTGTILFANLWVQRCCARAVPLARNWSSAKGSVVVRITAGCCLDREGFVSSFRLLVITYRESKPETHLGSLYSSGRPPASRWLPFPSAASPPRASSCRSAALRQSRPPPADPEDPE